MRLFHHNGNIENTHLKYMHLITLNCVNRANAKAAMPLEVMGRDVQGLGWDGDLVVGCLHLQAQNSCPSQIGFLKFPDQLLVVLCT